MNFHLAVKLVVVVAFVGCARAGFFSFGGEEAVADRAKRATSDSAQCPSRLKNSPLDYFRGYDKQTCKCRSSASCDAPTTALKNEENLCFNDDLHGRKRVAVTIDLSGCCQTSAMVDQVLSGVVVEVWQPSNDGVYTQRSGCGQIMKTNESGRITFHAPVPKQAASFGADGATSILDGVGFINVVIPNFKWPEGSSTQFSTSSVRLFYPHTSTGAIGKLETSLLGVVLRKNLPRSHSSRRLRRHIQKREGGGRRGLTKFLAPMCFDSLEK